MRTNSQHDERVPAHLLSRHERRREARGIRPEREVASGHDSGCKCVPVERRSEEINEDRTRQAKNCDGIGIERQLRLALAPAR